MKVKLKDVHPNPFRDMDGYPIHQQKILQLKNSVQSTEFWENVVAREREGGGIEIAYGHHRLTALRELYDGDKEFNWIVKDLSDSEMLKIMAHENLDEWGHDSAIERETVRAVVLAYADGKISLKRPDQKTATNKMRYAPFFSHGKQAVARSSAESAEHRCHPYNADTINSFLGGTMSARTIQYTLQALSLIERGHLKESQLKDMSSNECRVIVEETERSIKQAKQIEKEADRKASIAATPVLAKQLRREGAEKAKQVVKETAKSVSKAIQGNEGAAAARKAATNARVAVAPKETELPEINKAASGVSSSLLRLLDPDYKLGSQLEDLIKFKSHLSGQSVQSLDHGLSVVIEYAEGYRARLK